MIKWISFATSIEELYDLNNRIIEQKKTLDETSEVYDKLTNLQYMIASKVEYLIYAWWKAV